MIKHLISNSILMKLQKRVPARITRCKLLESCKALLQAFDDTMLLDKLSQQEIITLIDTGE